jgi:hypothetical protein
VDWKADPDWEWRSAASDPGDGLIRESIDGQTGE